MIIVKVDAICVFTQKYDMKGRQIIVKNKYIVVARKKC